MCLERGGGRINAEAAEGAKDAEENDSGTNSRLRVGCFWIASFERHGRDARATASVFSAKLRAFASLR